MRTASPSIRLGLPVVFFPANGCLPYSDQLYAYMCILQELSFEFGAIGTSWNPLLRRGLGAAPITLGYRAPLTGQALSCSGPCQDRSSQVQAPSRASAKYRLNSSLQCVT